MDRKGAMAVIREAIDAAPVKPGDAEGVKFKGLAIAALIIAEESLNDFAKMAEAIKELASQPRAITYAGPRHFRIVGSIAETFDPYEVKGPTLFDQNKG